jgi:hypothetical protein
MPVLISDEDYNEYRILQHNALFQQKLESVRGMKNLKDDIDIPVRNLVAMFALLGCKPLWSCCGFDYDRQPMHKTHEYGDTYIVLTVSKRTLEVIATLINHDVLKLCKQDELLNTDDWIVWRAGNKLLLRCDFDYVTNKTQYPWSMKSCIHYYEYAVIKIQDLERAILKLFGDKFADTAILYDTNNEIKQHLYNWQYPILENWIITKEDIIR